MHPRILSFGLLSGPLAARNQRLLEAGFVVDAVGGAQSAMFLLGFRRYAALVIGQGVAESERIEVAREAKRIAAATVVIMLYEGRIVGTEDADAVLHSSTGDPTLHQTLWRLLGDAPLRRPSAAPENRPGRPN